MSTADFFARLGLFIAREFFDQKLCDSLSKELSVSVRTRAPVRKSGQNLVIDPTTRKTGLARLSNPQKSLVNARLDDIQSSLARHFQLPLKGWEDPQFLVYQVGDFFRPHSDNATDRDAPEYIRKRKVSLVIFLNAAGPKSVGGSYSGGDLTLYGLIDDPQWRRIGFPLKGEKGLLVAFPSNVTHEVSPVAHGERYTFVSWFF